MKRRDSIRLKAAVAYLLRLSVAVIPIILLFALIAWISNPILVKGVFAFYAVGMFILYVYMSSCIYSEEVRVNDYIFYKYGSGRIAEFETVMFHPVGDLIVVIPCRNVELLKRLPERYIFLDELDWRNLYQELIEKDNEGNKPFSIYFNSNKVSVSKLNKYYYKEEGRYYMM